MQVPSDHLDKLWGEYERFERGAGGTQSRANPAAARFIDEMRPRFQAARTAWTKRKSFLDRLQPTALPAVPGKSPGGSLFMDQRRLWLAFLEFEMSNTQSLDARTHRLRVNLSYQQALYPLRNCPEVCMNTTLDFVVFGRYFSNKPGSLDASAGLHSPQTVCLEPTDRHHEGFTGASAIHIACGNDLLPACVGSSF
jgi:hypothetical protein